MTKSFCDCCGAELKCVPTEVKGSIACLHPHKLQKFELDFCEDCREAASLFFGEMCDAFDRISKPGAPLKLISGARK